MAQETDAEKEAPAEAAPKTGLAKRLPLMGGIVGGIALGATLGFTLLGPKLSHKSAAKAAVAADSAKTKGGEIKKGEAAPSIYQLDNLVMNPAGSDGAHFLLVSVALQLKDAGSLETLKGRDAELRDAILRLFSRKTTEQISDVAARDELSGELMTLLAQMFGAGTVTKIYFPQFVIQ